MLLGGLLLLAGACGPTRAMTAGDARSFTRRALERVGFRRVEVTQVRGGQYRPEIPQPGGVGAIDVWKTAATVDANGHVDLYVDRTGDNAVFVHDVGPGGEPLLSAAQVDRLDRFRYDPVRHRLERDARPVAIVAGALILIVGAGLAVALAAGR